MMVANRMFRYFYHSDAIFKRSKHYDEFVKVVDKAFSLPRKVNFNLYNNFDFVIKNVLCVFHR